MACSSHVHFCSQTPLCKAFPKILCPKTKNPLAASGSKLSCAVSNYRIAPRLLDGWVPKSKPIRIGAAIHGRILFRLSRGNNKYFSLPLLLGDLFQLKRETPLIPSSARFSLQISIKQHGNAVSRETTGISSPARTHGPLPILPALNLL